MDGQVTVWDTNTFTVAHAFKLNGITHAARMSPVATTHSLIASQTNNGLGTRAVCASGSLVAVRCSRMCRLPSRLSSPLCQLAPLTRTFACAT